MRVLWMQVEESKSSSGAQVLQNMLNPNLQVVEIVPETLRSQGDCAGYIRPCPCRQPEESTENLLSSLNPFHMIWVVQIWR